MHVHLDAVGGVAGDMFVAALVDARADCAQEVEAAVQALGLGNRISVSFAAHHDGVLRGRRFRVHCPKPPHSTPAGDVREIIAGSQVESRVRERALAMLELLAEAESEVHGIPPARVEFHELGGLDTPVDLISAATLIEALDSPSWSCGVLPRGRGMVESAHGALPVPTPAVAILLQGMLLADDGIEGERITPTGAAILRHLDPDQTADQVPRRLEATGHGFGTSTFEGRSNILRAQLHSVAPSIPSGDDIAVLTFDVDDQTPEDLAAGLERIRAAEGVLDVTQQQVTAKHGRMAVRIQVLAWPSHMQSVSACCFRETTTLGLRWTRAHRLVLSRQMVTIASNDRSLRVKVADRPDGVRTAKAELADLDEVEAGHAARADLRQQVEAEALARSSADQPERAGGDRDD